MRVRYGTLAVMIFTAAAFFLAGVRTAAQPSTEARPPVEAQTPEQRAKAEELRRELRELRSRGVTANVLWVLDADDHERGPWGDQLLKKLAAMKVPTREKAQAVAIRYKLGRDLRADEGANITALVRIARSVADFAAKGDYIWVVHFAVLDGVTQELWINAATGAVRPVLPWAAGLPGWKPRRVESAVRVERRRCDTFGSECSV